MPPTKPCPVCGHKCIFKELTPCIVFGYECEKCGKTFGITKIIIGWKE